MLDHATATSRAPNRVQVIRVRGTHALTLPLLVLPVAAPGCTTDETKQLNGRIDHVVNLIGDIGVFNGPDTISSTVAAIKTNITRLQTRPDAAMKTYKMPHFDINKFDDDNKSDALTWWQRFLTEASCRTVPADDMMKGLYLQLIGGAQAWMNHLAATKKCTIGELHTHIPWKEFEQLWFTRFMVHNIVKAAAMNEVYTCSQAGHGRLYGVLESRGGGTRPCGSPGSTESADAGTLRPIRSSSVSRARNGKTSSAAGASASVSFVPPSTSQCPGTANFGSKVNSSCKTWAPSPVRSPPGCSTRDKGVRKSGSGSAAISSSTDGRWNLYGVWDRHQQVDDGKLLGGPLIGGSVMPLLARGLDGIAMGRVGVGASAWIGVGGLDGKKNNVQKGAPLLHRRKMEKQTQLKGCSSGTDASVASDQRIANWKPYGMPSPNRTSPRGGSGSIGKSNSAANSEQTTNSEKGGQLHRDLVLAPQGHRRAKSDVFGVGLSPVNGVCKPVSNEALNMGGAESLLPYVRPRPEVPESQASMGRVCGAKGSLTEEEVNDCSLSARRAGGQGVSLCAPAAANCQGETVRIELVGIRSLDSDARKPNGQQSRAQAIIHSVETPILRAQSADGNPPAAMGGAHGSSAMLVNVYPVSGKGGKPLQDFSSEVLDASGDWNAPVANEANGLFVSAVLASTGEQPSAREAEMPAGTEGDESDIRSGMVVDAPASYQESSQECVEQVVVRSLSEGGSRLMADLLSRGTEDSEVKQAIERNPGKTPELEQEKRKEGPLEVTPETLWKEDVLVGETGERRDIGGAEGAGNVPVAGDDASEGVEVAVVGRGVVAVGCEEGRETGREVMGVEEGVVEDGGGVVLEDEAWPAWPRETGREVMGVEEGVVEDGGGVVLEDEAWPAWPAERLWASWPEEDGRPVWPAGVDWMDWPEEEGGDDVVTMVMAGVWFSREVTRSDMEIMEASILRSEAESA
ncbi:hypothetical protein CBR_g12162 [Chara braunii]|uniref:Uncharacterized protein n=1 Tax=Chara braunii TaxID=69332 RepID=A0A388KR97_CHABU|nr:hypothetical protein CBR_g12162 [Chara braunii]|eukprot:GBG72590.1 hypothetical protein CBR_g12162 [Chara braunii]